MTHFMFNFLPSFYSDFMVDANGKNILTPLFDQYANCIGDTIYQAQQLSQAPYLEKCPLYTQEYFKTIDVRFSNTFGTNNYLIDPTIIGFSNLYLDANLTIALPNTFSVMHDEATNTRYIHFDSALDPRVNVVYAQYCYKNQNLLRDIFGRLLNYQPVFTFKQYGSTYLTEQQTYRNQLLAILYCTMNGQTFKTIQQSLGIFLGLQYAPFNAIVRSVSSGSITLENVLTGDVQTITGNINTSLTFGSLISKYDILEILPFLLYDIYTDPNRFMQYLIASNSTQLLALLNIDIANKEQYAHLTFDSITAFDNDNLFWDMGNGTGMSGVVPTDKVYEMFRNVFVIEASQSLVQINYFLNRFKPIYTKFLIR